MKEKQAICHQSSPLKHNNNPAEKISTQSCESLIMNLSASECSSGCESGWTTYLDQLSNYTDPYSRAFVTDYEGKGAYVSEDQEDEDLSMVSDASSGPPHSQEYENCAFETHYYGYSSSVSQQRDKNKQKSKSKETRAKREQSLCLDDDTASSPIFHFSQDNVPPPDSHGLMDHVSGFSQVCSAAQFEGESKTKKHLSFLKSSTKRNSGGFAGKKEAVRSGKSTFSLCSTALVQEMGFQK